MNIQNNINNNNMNKIEFLPKNIDYKDNLYQLAMWVTAFDRLCIGYRNSLDVNCKEALFSVCVEPENTPRSILSTIGYLNEYVGNAISVDDACKELLNWIDMNKDDFKCY